MQDVAERLRDVHAEASARIDARQNYVWANDDHPDVQYEGGDIVLVHNPAGATGKAKKLMSRWEGPYLVVRRTGPVNYEVMTQGRKRRSKMIVHVSKMRPFKDRNELLEDADNEVWSAPGRPVSEEEDEHSEITSSDEDADAYEGSDGAEGFAEEVEPLIQSDVPPV